MDNSNIEETVTKTIIEDENIVRIKIETKQKEAKEMDEIALMLFKGEK